MGNNTLKLLNSLQNINSDVGVHVDERLEGNVLTMGGTEVEGLSLDSLDIFTIRVFGKVSDTQNVQNGVGLDVRGDGVLENLLKGCELESGEEGSKVTSQEGIDLNVAEINVLNNNKECVGLELEDGSLGISFALGWGAEMEELSEIVLLSAWWEEGSKALGVASEESFVEMDAGRADGDECVSELVASVGGFPEATEVGNEG